MASSTRGSSWTGPTSTSSRAKIAAGQEPWTSALAKMSTTGAPARPRVRPASYRYSSLSYPPSPVPVIQEAGSGHTAYINAHPELGLANIGGVEHLDDARAAYTHALLWYYTGNQETRPRRSRS